eukprot:469696-Prorocentrum_minimum.AAC.3
MTDTSESEGGAPGRLRGRSTCLAARPSYYPRRVWGSARTAVSSPACASYAGGPPLPTPPINRRVQKV